ncbi:SAM-dependent methyltransferase [Granulicella arctica]|uniref:Cyclopropane-fatty-acyl-phospholipid synthase n=1 Tax=Granulicella arctica TaxID=940613 RepID=A0A7Y9TGC7_9BACT|nr:cyclopropane-fatty-acyl-phospholipid synthase family protein [Granulicella arctica]NYF78610.1 cyclopropane-fatty-acyl-phospholipid synthase [Granulicella arctica]
MSTQATTTYPNATLLDLTSNLVERDLIPDAVLRIAIRRLLAKRLRDEERGGLEGQTGYLRQLIQQIKISRIALNTQEANEQHYEVPPRFFELTLGRRLKYSSGYWPAGVDTLDASEEAMLALTVERARIVDGHEILELGCGWGSLTLYMAEHFPNSAITAVSNSAPQREFIEAKLRAMGREDVRIVTCDMNTFSPGGTFDRVVSVEMFEHMRNYEELLSRVASWMRPEALLFVHIFTHKQFSYPFEVRDASDWMAKHFFTGGIMPGDNLLLNFQRDVEITDHWMMSGTHYQRTSRAWLDKTDEHREEVLQLFEQTYAGTLPPKRRRREANMWLVRWRLFYMACEELWGYDNGNEWGVSHYLFHRRG